MTRERTDSYRSPDTFAVGGLLPRSAWPAWSCPRCTRCSP